jgi:serine/threonine protein kinase
MDFIAGTPIDEYCDANHLTVRQRLEFFITVCSAVHYAHQNLVIHRDIKPGNVLMTEDGRAVLADFGLAWLLEGAHLTLTGGVIGTPEYMSPEQAAGNPIDHRSDVYALGVVLYEMLVGDRPFVAETPIGVLLMHLQDQAPSVLEARPDLPEEVGAVLDKVLAKNPDERYSSAGELARAFRAAFAGHQPRLAVESPPLEVPPDEIVPWEAEVLDCPGCGEKMPAGAGICPKCKYMIPLDQLPRPPSRVRLERRELIVNLLPQSIRWSPDGLQLARRLAAQALREATTDGWEPASIGVPFKLVEGRTISGPVVESAIIKLERFATPR